MLTLAVKHDDLDVARNRGEEILEPPDGGVVERVAFMWARQAQDTDGAARLEMKGGRECAHVLAVGVRCFHNGWFADCPIAV